MASISRTQRGVLPQIQAPPEWGIEPVPQNQRVLGLVRRQSGPCRVTDR